MEIFLYLCVGFLGAILGSFLNVVIFRYNSGITFLGRSMCFTCAKTILWRDLVPIFSFAALGGKCRFCRSKISWHYAAVEGVTAALFMLFFWKTGGLAGFLGAESFSYFVNLLFLFALGCFLVVITGYDIKHKIIPDAFSYGFAALALAKLVFFPSFAPTSWDYAAGLILAAPFALMWLVSGGRWMGLGDAKLVLGIGWLLGLRAGLTAVVLAFWIGAVFGLASIAIGKFAQSSFFASIFRQRMTLKSEIPFAPFLIIGLLLAFFVPQVMDTAGVLLF